MKTDICYLYTLRCPTTDEVKYVGKSVHPYVRLQSHLHERKSNKPKCDWIDSLISQGLSPVMIIEKALSLEYWEDHEKRLIEKYRRSGNIFNIQAGGNDILTTVKAVYQYSLSGEYIDYFNSLTEAGDRVGVEVSSISGCCKGKLGSAGGFIWSYKYEEVEPWSNHRHTPIIRYNMDSTFSKRYDSICYVKEDGISTRSVGRHLKGASLSAGGYLWSYEGEDCPPPPVRLKNSVFVEHNTSTNEYVVIKGWMELQKRTGCGFARLKRHINNRIEINDCIYTKALIIPTIRNNE